MDRFKQDLETANREAGALLLLATALRLQGDDPLLLSAGELAGGIAYVLAANEEVRRKIEEASKG